ncbi:phosphoglucosamine mutase [candidate division KSB1 bacterium]
MQSLMISVSGIRGIVGEGLTPDIVARFSTAFGLFCGGGPIVVGRDTRLSGPMFEHAVFSGLMAAGCEIINLGMCTTPTIQLAVEKLKARGGIAITASHNPEDWNAVKFMDNRGMFLNAQNGLEVLEIAESKQEGYVHYRDIGTVSHIDNFNIEHIKAIICSGTVKPEKMRHRNFNVVVDCVNGAGSIILPDLLLELGCDVTKINCTPNGDFSRGAEPVPENLGDLCETVVNTKADIGFACDPDADRLAVVDEKGRPLSEEYTLVLSAKLVLSEKKGDIAANVSTTAALDVVAQEAGVKIHRTKVGEIHVVQKMIEQNCVIGGEGNGGVIFPEIHYGRDAMVGTALILQYLSEFEEPLSKLYDRLPHYYISKRKVTVESKTLNHFIEKTREENYAAKIDTTDGLKLIFPHYWVHLRKSNTEPIVRVIAEAKSTEEADSVSGRYAKMLAEQ